MRSSNDEPLFSFGVITDIHYADIPDGQSFDGVPRYYRHSIRVLQRAIQCWNTQKNLMFVINLGDIVDGKCRPDESASSVAKIISEFDNFNGSVYHIIGNHCLYNLPRVKLHSLLKIPTRENHAYYDFSPIPGYRFVVIDGYDINAIEETRDHPTNLRALQFLGNNPNSDKNSPEGLDGVERRFVMFNGGVGEEQMRWLENVLKEATVAKVKVVICCHLPLHPGISSYAQGGLLWNFDEVMGLIHKYHCVKVCLSGHYHKGGYVLDCHGIHHRSFEAVIDCCPGTDSYGCVDVYHDKILINGVDRMKNTSMFI